MALRNSDSGNLPVSDIYEFIMLVLTNSHTQILNVSLKYFKIIFTERIFRIIKQHVMDGKIQFDTISV